MFHPLKTGTLSILLCGTFLSSALAQSQPTRVIVTPVSRAIFADTLEAIGTAQANESIMLTTKVTEIIDQINFSDGMQVNSGDVLVKLDNREERADLQEARINLEEQQREFRRVSELVKKKALPSLQLDEQRSRLGSTEARLAAAQARLDDRLIIAPFSGIMGFRQLSPGALVEPGTVIATLDDISLIKLDFSIPETFLSTLHSGLTVIAHSRAYPDQDFRGQVKAVDSRIDPVTRAVSVRAEIPNPDFLLKPGMLLNVNLIRNQRESLMIPESALLPSANGQFVYIVNAENQVEKQKIRIGRRQPGQVEILDGLNEGIQVIIEGAIKVKPGDEVRTSPMQGKQTNDISVEPMV